MSILHGVIWCECGIPLLNGHDEEHPGECCYCADVSLGEEPSLQGHLNEALDALAMIRDLCG